MSAGKHSCESVLESFVSRYENHFDARRSTSEETTNEEFEIDDNGHVGMGAQSNINHSKT